MPSFCEKSFVLEITSGQATPCDLGVIDNTVLNSVSIPDITVLNSVQSFGVFPPMSFILEWTGGCYFYESICSGLNLPTSCFTTYGHQLLYNNGFNTFTLLQNGFDRCDRSNDGSCTPQPADCTFFSGQTTLDLYHGNGTVDLKFNGSGGYDTLTRHNGSPNPTWQIRRTKKPVVNPPARLRVVNFAGFVPALVGCSGATNQSGEPDWDGTMPNPNFINPFSGWRWLPDFTSGLKLNGKVLSTSTRVQHSQNDLPTETQCGWLLQVDFDEFFGSWVGIGGSGYSPEGTYAFIAGVPFFTLCSQKTDARAGTVSPLPANTRVGNVLTADANGILPAIDGITLVVADRVLVKDEAITANRGIYSVTSVGSAITPWILTRSTDSDTSPEVTQGIFCKVLEGAGNGSFYYRLTTLDPIVLNTTGLVFTQIPASVTVEAY